MPTMTSYPPGQFCWVDFTAHDAVAASEFYARLFGWYAEEQDTGSGPPYWIFKIGDQQIGGLGQMSEEMASQGIPPMWNSYVAVEDVDAIAKKVPTLGGIVTMPPMPVPGAGWMAFLQDPTGGNLAIWQKDQHFGAELIGETGTCCWNELATKDLDKAKDFFSGLFGWEYKPNPHAPAPYAIIKNQGLDVGGLMQMTEEWGDIPSHWMVYFATEDVQATADKTAELGGQVCVPPFDTPVGPISVLTDPQGGTFSVIHFTGLPEEE